MAAFMEAPRKRDKQTYSTIVNQLYLLAANYYPAYTMTRVSVSLPDWLVKIIDTERGNVPRSRYIFRLIQRINKHVIEEQ